jgi:hypothetical protein
MLTITASMPVQAPAAVADEAHEGLREGAVERKEIIQMCMESPLYFTMPLSRRLEFVKKREQAYASNGLREDLLNWVKTGQFNHQPPNLGHERPTSHGSLED